MNGHDDSCEFHAYGTCDCAARADTTRRQAENRDRLNAASDYERDDVLAWVNDHHPDILRDAMDETEAWR